MNWLYHEEEFKRIAREELEELKRIRRGIDLLVDALVPRLTTVALQFTNPQEGSIMGSTPAPNVPTTLTLPIGQVSVASVVGFDQNGQPFNGPIPQPVYTIDQPGVASIASDSNPLNEDVTGVSAGVANMTAGVAGPNGTLTCQGVITVTGTTQVLTSIALAFTPPAATSQASAALKRG